jgi:hypothetical protein
MENTRGISAIVATVLIVLISIVGVGIIWGVILPLFGEMDYIGYSDVKLDIVTQGYTVYDPDLHFAFVQVARGNDDLDLAAIEVVFDINGSSVPYRNTDVPGKNEKKTYKFDFDNDGITGVPSSVSIAPVFDLNGQERVGELIATAEIPVQRTGLSPTEVQTIGSPIVSVVREDYETTTTFTPINTSCTTNQACNDGSSCTVNDTQRCVNGTLESTCRGTLLSEIYDNDVDENCDGWVDLTRCAVLNQSGRNYRLAGDLQVNSFSGASCFNIAASNVSFNLNGKTIYTLADLKGSAIVSENQNYVQVSNGKIRGFDNVSLNLSNVHQGLFQNLLIEATGGGIYLKDGASNTFRNIVLNYNKVYLGEVCYFGSFCVGNYYGEGIHLIRSSRGNFSNITIIDGYSGLVSEQGDSNVFEFLNLENFTSSTSSFVSEVGSTFYNSKFNSSWQSSSFRATSSSNLLILNSSTVGASFVDTVAYANGTTFLGFYYAPDFVGPPAPPIGLTNSTLWVNGMACNVSGSCTFFTSPPGGDFVGPMLP